MKALYLDCFAGISGNMLLGALLDAGVPEDYLIDELGKLAAALEADISISSVRRNGIAARFVDVRLKDGIKAYSYDLIRRFTIPEVSYIMLTKLDVQFLPL